MLRTYARINWQRWTRFRRTARLRRTPRADGVDARPTSEITLLTNCLVTQGCSLAKFDDGPIKAGELIAAASPTARRFVRHRPALPSNRRLAASPSSLSLPAEFRRTFNFRSNSSEPSALQTSRPQNVRLWESPRLAVSPAASSMISAVISSCRTIRSVVCK